jgi:large subunit ribosomal protein L40e
MARFDESEKRNLDVLICSKCNARNPKSAKRCRKCDSTQLRRKHKEKKGK